MSAYANFPHFPANFQQLNDFQWQTRPAIHIQKVNLLKIFCFSIGILFKFLKYVNNQCGREKEVDIFNA